jgi:GxxExxY protein
MPLHDPETFAIIGAAMEVHAVLGCGFLEAVYRAALVIEFDQRAIAHEREVQLPIDYKEQKLPFAYRVDFVCYGKVLVEVKALATLGSVEHSQAVHYLRASGLRRALLLNFGGARLEHRRLVADLPAPDDPLGTGPIRRP